MGEHQSHHRSEGRTDLFLQPIRFANDVHLQKAQISAEALTKHGLANVAFLSGDSPLERRLIDFSPKRVFDHGNVVATEDSYCLAFITHYASRAYIELTMPDQKEERLATPDDALATVLFNIEHDVGVIANVPGLYEAFTHYLVAPSDDAVAALAASLRRDDGVIELADKQFIVSALHDENPTKLFPHTIEVFSQSNDQIMQKELRIRLTSALDSMPESSDLIAAENDVYTYLAPLLRAAKGVSPNRFAIEALINTYKDSLPTSGRPNSLRREFAGTPSYAKFRNVQETIRQTALASDHDIWQEFAGSFLDGSLDAQLTHFFAMFDFYFANSGEIDPTIETWIESAYPAGSPMRVIAEHFVRSNGDIRTLKTGLQIASRLVDREGKFTPEEKAYQLKRIDDRSFLIDEVGPLFS